jgi:hypothetical protein
MFQQGMPPKNGRHDAEAVEPIRVNRPLTRCRELVNAWESIAVVQGKSRPDRAAQVRWHDACP